MWQSAKNSRNTVQASSGVLNKVHGILLFFFIFSLAAVALSAQTIEDYRLLKSYVLPDTAISLSETNLVGNVLYHRSEPFSGLTFERYANQRLARVQSWRSGILDGPSYVWYQGGEPQMSVNYRRGKIHGRFLGWYMHGGILYDMVINDRGYAGDNLSDDGSRESGTETDDEREGTDND